ncbi:unnamed protein product [Caenorhabditis sp. 36 PRJEB53466]|nr:unnamed protein product [Caenorhabditis sp. 36 PRJEB53466]
MSTANAEEEPPKAQLTPVSVPEKFEVPTERERNIGEKKNGYEYFIVVINYRPGLKFGLGIKNVFKSIFVIKAEENSIVTGLFNVADRIIDVDGEPVNDNNRCKGLLIRGLKEKKTVSLLVERGITEKTLKAATDEMNEEHTQSVMAPPDVRSIMRKMELRIRKSPSAEGCVAPAPIPSALSKNKEGAKMDRKPIVVEDGHKSVMIRMDNEENRDKLQKVAPKKPPPPPPEPKKPAEPHQLVNIIAPPSPSPAPPAQASPAPPAQASPAPPAQASPAPPVQASPAPAPTIQPPTSAQSQAPTQPSGPNDEACCEPGAPVSRPEEKKITSKMKEVSKSREVSKH